MTQTNKQKGSDLRVLAIVPSSFCYGLQHITLDFFERLSPNLEAHFLLTRWSDGEFSKELTKRNIAHSFSWMGMFSRNLSWPNIKMSLNCLVKIPRLYMDVIKLRRKFKPDLLYFANHHELILLYPLLLFNKIPVICHMHDPSPAIRFQKLTFRFYDRVVEKYIAISHNVKQRTILLGCNPNKIKVIHNGIAIDDQPVQDRGMEFINKFNWSADSYIIGLTGQMTSTKGHEDVIKAISLLTEKEIGSNLKLVIGGKKIEPYYTQLTSLIEKLNLTEKVAFSGWQNEVGTFFTNIDLFILSSRHDEGYGLVVAEAMASGKPVITTASGGVVEIVEDNTSGFIVPKMDPAVMADKIELLSRDSGMNQKMGIEARQRVIKLFDINKKVKDLLVFFMSYKNNRA